MAAVARLEDVMRARQLPQQSREDVPRLCRNELSGRITELSGLGCSALLTMGMRLVVDAQKEGEPTAWVMVGGETFFPPDAARAGVDLQALAVVRAPTVHQGSSAAARLARSGAFGLVVVDLSGTEKGRGVHMPTAHLSRLVGLAQKHDTAVVFLTTKDAEQPSLDSLVSLRGTAIRDQSLGNGRFRCLMQVLKDKRRGPHWKHRMQCVGPSGLW